MAEKKTTFQNWVDIHYPIGERHKLAKKAGLRENQITRDYNNPNGLKMIEKYHKILGIKSVDFHGHDYGCEIKGTLKIK